MLFDMEVFVCCAGKTTTAPVSVYGFALFCDTCCVSDKAIRQPGSCRPSWQLPREETLVSLVAELSGAALRFHV
jgi:hypothetical protein